MLPGDHGPLGSSWSSSTSRALVFEVLRLVQGVGLVSWACRGPWRASVPSPCPPAQAPEQAAPTTDRTAGTARCRCYWAGIDQSRKCLVAALVLGAYPPRGT